MTDASLGTSRADRIKLASSGDGLAFFGALRTDDLDALAAEFNLEMNASN
jgi:hypothetical protein